MAGIINLANGLSAMGNAVSATAGTMAVEQQRADLDNQKEMLASQLAEGRETRLEGLKASNAAKLSAQESGQRTSEYATEKQTDIRNLPAMAKAQDDILKTQASDPAYVKALRTMTDAKATPEQRAAANLYSVQAIGAKISNAANQELLDARQDLEKATQTGDQAGIKAAQQRYFVAQYSTHDEVQRAATLAAQENNDRLQVTNIQTQLDAKQIPVLGESQEMSTARTAAVTRLKADLDVAQSQYASSHAMAVEAARNLPALDIGGSGTAAGKRPPLSSFNNPPPGP